MPLYVGDTAYSDAREEKVFCSRTCLQQWIGRSTTRVMDKLACGWVYCPICAVLLLILAFAPLIKAQQRITEDDPRWDCRTMGDKICAGDGGVVRDIREHQGHVDATLVSGRSRVELSEFASLGELRSWAQKHGYSVQVTAPKPVYYCGALTKKGTPCKHWVKKAGERCWQHRGKGGAQ
jgi:hypothetical protein